MHVRTCGHELLQVARWEGVVFGSDEVQVVPVRHFDVGTQLDGVGSLLVGQVYQETTAKEQQVLRSQGLP